MHAEAPRGAALVPVLALQRAQHIGVLEAVARFLEREHTGAGVAAPPAGLVDRQIEGQVVEPYDKLPAIKPGNIDYCLKSLSPVARDGHLTNLRAVMNFAKRQNLITKNPVDSLEFAHRRPTTEIKPLPNDLVEAMLKHAAAKEINLLPYLTIGFYCGCREAELNKLLWSDVNLEDSRLMVRAEVPEGPFLAAA